MESVVVIEKENANKDGNQLLLELYKSLKAEKARLDVNYYEMYQSREQWRNYCMTIKSTSARYLDELRRREIEESILLKKIHVLQAHFKPGVESNSDFAQSVETIADSSVNVELSDDSTTSKEPALSVDDFEIICLSEPVVGTSSDAVTPPKKKRVSWAESIASVRPLESFPSSFTVTISPAMASKPLRSILSPRNKLSINLITSSNEEHEQNCEKFLGSSENNSQNVDGEIEPEISPPPEINSCLSSSSGTSRKWPYDVDGDCYLDDDDYDDDDEDDFYENDDVQYNNFSMAWPSSRSSSHFVPPASSHVRETDTRKRKKPS